MPEAIEFNEDREREDLETPKIIEEGEFDKVDDRGQAEKEKMDMEWRANTEASLSTQLNYIRESLAGLTTSMSAISERIPDNHPAKGILKTYVPSYAFDKTITGSVSAVEHKQPTIELQSATKDLKKISGQIYDIMDKADGVSELLDVRSTESTMLKSLAKFAESYLADIAYATELIQSRQAEKPVHNTAKFPKQIHETTQEMASQERLALAYLIKRQETQDNLDRLNASKLATGGKVHDLNNLLTSILGYNQLLDRNITNQGLQKQLNEIKNAGNEMALMAKFLLPLCRKRPAGIPAQDLTESLNQTSPTIFEQEIERLQRFAINRKAEDRAFTELTVPLQNRIIDLLNSVKSSATTAADQNKDKVKFLNQIISATDRGLKLMSESGEDKVSLNLVSTVRELEMGFQQIPDTQKRNIAIEMQLTEQPLFSSIDKSLLSEAVHNLVKNAVEASPDNGIVKVAISNTNINLKTVDTLKNAISNNTLYSPDSKKIKSGKYNVIQVSDTGHGMEQKVATQIFQGKSFNKKDGNGFGMVKLKNAVDNAGGFITFRSEPDTGTTFYIYLPDTTDQSRPSETIASKAVAA